MLKSSSALGPGGLTNLHLKHLGQKGFLLLHQLKSAVLRRCVVESAGVAFIIPWPLEQLQQQLYDHQSFPLLRLGNSFKRQQTISQQIRWQKNINIRSLNSSSTKFSPRQARERKIRLTGNKISTLSTRWWRPPSGWTRTSWPQSTSCWRMRKWMQTFLNRRLFQHSIGTIYRGFAIAIKRQRHQNNHGGLVAAVSGQEHEDNLSPHLNKQTTSAWL